MKHVLPILSVICVASVVVCACNPAPAKPADKAPATGATMLPGIPGPAHRGAPSRKNGWWEFASVTSTGRKLGTQGLCVSDATEAVFSSFDQITQELLIGTRCSKADFRPASGGFDFETVCDSGISADLGGGIVTSRGHIGGDLATRYEIEMAVTQAGETNHGKITAGWKGACPAARKPGDLVVDGDLSTNILEK